MRSVRILDHAAEEAAKAATWYESEWPGLGKEFIEAVESAIDVIEDNFLPLVPMPGIAGTVHGAKRLVLKQFPHDIVIIDRHEEALVIAIAHHCQIPDPA